MDTDKKRVLEELEKAHGVVSVACHNSGISRSTFYNWKNTDSEFAEGIIEANEAAIDHVESKLFGRVDSNDTTAIIFFLKTRAKERGYVERQEVTGKDGDPLVITFEKVPSFMNGIETKGTGGNNNNGHTLTKSGYV